MVNPLLADYAVATFKGTIVIKVEDASVGVYFSSVFAEPVHLLENQLLCHLVFEHAIDVIRRKLGSVSVKNEYSEFFLIYKKRVTSKLNITYKHILLFYSLYLLILPVF